MKKTLCVIIAMIIALSSFAIVSYAAVPDISMTVNNTANAKAGDIITVEVKVKEKSSLIAATLYLIYDNDFFKLVSMAPIEESMQPIVNAEYEKNKALYAGVHVDRLRDEAVLFTAQFEVLKRGGKISLEAKEVYYIADSQRKNVTSEVNDSFKNDTVTIICPHAEKTTTNVSDPTCSAEGKKVETCNECGSKTDIVIPKLPHNGVELVIKETTCKEPGKKGKLCIVCEQTYDETTIPALAHDIKEVVTKKASCEEVGKKVEQCKNCDYKGKETEIPATGHTEGKWETVKNPTKTEPGLEQKKCTVCGKVLDTNEIPVVVTYKLGDVNEDGHITAVDARIVLRYVAGLVELTPAQKLAADTNKNGDIGATDARLILQYVVGKVKF